MKDKAEFQEELRILLHKKNKINQFAQAMLVEFQSADGIRGAVERIQSIGEELNKLSALATYALSFSLWESRTVLAMAYLGLVYDNQIIALLSLAQVLLKNNYWAQARRLAEFLEEELDHPFDARTQDLIRKAYLVEGKWKRDNGLVRDACHVLQRLVKMAPNDSEATSQLKKTCAQLVMEAISKVPWDKTHWEATRQELKRCQELVPHDDALAQLLTRLNQECFGQAVLATAYPEAQDIAEHWAQDDAENHDAIQRAKAYYIISTRQLIGSTEFESALQHVETWLTHHEMDRESQDLLADCYTCLVDQAIRGKKWNQARHYIRKCEEQLSGACGCAGRLRDTYLIPAEQAITAKNWEEARDHLREWLKARPNDDEAKQMLGRVYDGLAEAQILTRDWENAVRTMASHQELGPALHQELGPAAPGPAGHYGAYPFLGWLHDADKTFLEDSIDCAKRPATAATSSDGRTLVIGCVGGEVLVWDQPTRELRHLGQFGSPVQSVAISRSGKHIAAGDQTGNMETWTFGAGAYVSIRRAEAHTNSVDTLSFSADEAVLGSGSRDHTARTWHLAPAIQNPLVSSLPIGGPAFSLALASTGRPLAASSGGQSNRLQLCTGGPVPMVIAVPTQIIRSLSLSAPAAKYLAAGGDSQTIDIWDITHPSSFQPPAHTLKHDSSPVVALSFLPCAGEYCLLASGGRDGVVKIWDVHKAQVHHELPKQRGMICDLVFSDTGELFVVTLLGKSVLVRRWKPL